MTFFLGQFDLWKFSVGLALYNSYLPFFLGQHFFFGPLEKNPTKIWEANPPLLMPNK
jgi:hypothetical protein